MDGGIQNQSSIHQLANFSKEQEVPTKKKTNSVISFGFHASCPRRLARTENMDCPNPRKSESYSTNLICVSSVSFSELFFDTYHDFAHFLPQTRRFQPIHNSAAMVSMWLRTSKCTAFRSGTLRKFISGKKKKAIFNLLIWGVLAMHTSTSWKGFSLQFPLL